jgi:ferredoxin-NADP reductase
MTAPLLLAWICAALLLQVVAGISVAVWQQHRAPNKPSDTARDLHSPLPSGAWTGWREFRVARRTFEDEDHSQCSFHLEPVDGIELPSFKPGQFLTFQLAVGDDAEARTIVRCYSLSDRPVPGGYRVTIKRVPAPVDRPDLPPGASSTHFHDRIHEGDILRIKAPSGHFHIDDDAKVPVVLIAGGIGITPMMSMLRWCLDEQPERTVHLYYGLRHSGEKAFKSLLESIAASHSRFHLNVVYSRPDTNDVRGRDYQHAGHVTIDLVRQTLPHGRHQFYVCGPAAMMEDLVPGIAAWGVPEQDIHYEAFGPASVHLAPSAPTISVNDVSTPLEVHFQRSGRTLLWDGQDGSLLEFAERNGVSVDSGCRSGSCGSCETRLIEGTVRYTKSLDHDVMPGHCLLCVGTPASGITLEA